MRLRVGRRVRRIGVFRAFLLLRFVCIVVGWFCGRVWRGWRFRAVAGLRGSGLSGFSRGRSSWWWIFFGCSFIGRYSSGSGRFLVFLCCFWRYDVLFLGLIR